MCKHLPELPQRIVSIFAPKQKLTVAEIIGFIAEQCTASSSPIPTDFAVDLSLQTLVSQAFLRTTENDHRKKAYEIIIQQSAGSDAIPESGTEPKIRAFSEETVSQQAFAPDLPATQVKSKNMEEGPIKETKKQSPLPAPLVSTDCGNTVAADDNAHIEEWRLKKCIVITRKRLNFTLICETECDLAGKDFTGSTSQSELENMFFRNDVLSFHFSEGGATLTPRGLIECKLNKQMMRINRPHTLVSNEYYHLSIQNILYELLVNVPNH